MLLLNDNRAIGLFAIWVQDAFELWPGFSPAAFLASIRPASLPQGFRRGSGMSQSEGH